MDGHPTYFEYKFKVPNKVYHDIITIIVERAVTRSYA